MKLKLTFEVDCGNILVDPKCKEEMDWLKNEILKIGGKDWAIISGELGDDLGNESTTLLSYDIISENE